MGPKFWAAEGGVAPARAGWIETWKAAAGGPCGRDYAAALSLGGDCPRGVRCSFESSRNRSASSETSGPAFSAPCSTRWCMGCAHSAVSTSISCRAWQTSRFGPRHAKEAYGLPAPSPALMRQTAERRSKPSSRPTRSPLACAPSWPIGPCGWGALQTLCVCARKVLVMTSRRAAQGLKTREPWRVDCAGRKPSCGAWVLKSRSRGKVEPGPG
jgi:hypothetical protein